MVRAITSNFPRINPAFLVSFSETTSPAAQADLSTLQPGTGHNSKPSRLLQPGTQAQSDVSQLERLGKPAARSGTGFRTVQEAVGRCRRPSGGGAPQSQSGLRAAEPSNRRRPAALPQGAGGVGLRLAARQPTRSLAKPGGVRGG